MWSLKVIWQKLSLYFASCPSNVSQIEWQSWCWPFFPRDSKSMWFLYHNEQLIITCMSELWKWLSTNCSLGTRFRRMLKLTLTFDLVTQNQKGCSLMINFLNVKFEGCWGKITLCMVPTRFHRMPKLTSNLRPHDPKSMAVLSSSLTSYMWNLKVISWEL